jgi:hypothetical protein
MNNKLLTATIAILMAFVCGCSISGSGDVALVKNGYFAGERSMPVGQIFDKYIYFKKGVWKSYKSAQGQRVVEYTGTIDLAKDDAIKSRVADYNKAYNKKIAAAEFTAQFIVPADKTFGVANGVLILKYDSGTERRYNYPTDTYLPMILANTPPVQTNTPKIEPP